MQKVQERAEAERKAKAEKTKDWHKQQHEREQGRIQVCKTLLTQCSQGLGSRPTSIKRISSTRAKTFLLLLHGTTLFT